MSQIAIRAAFETALAAMTPTLATAHENETFDEPAPDVAYQRCFTLFAKPSNPEMGSGFQEIGEFRVNLMYPKDGNGTNAASTRAQALRTRFKRTTSLSSSGVTATVTGTPEIPAGVPDGDRWRVSVVIPFKADFFNT